MSLKWLQLFLDWPNWQTDWTDLQKPTNGNLFNFCDYHCKSFPFLRLRLPKPRLKPQVMLASEVVVAEAAVAVIIIINRTSWFFSPRQELPLLVSSISYPDFSLLTATLLGSLPWPQIQRTMFDYSPRSSNTRIQTAFPSACRWLCLRVWTSVQLSMRSQWCVL